MIQLVPTHTCQLAHEARFLACAPDRTRLLLAAADGRFTVLDGSLLPLHQGTLPEGGGAVAIHPRADRLAIASKAKIVLADFTGRAIHHLPHRPWQDSEGGAVAFVGDGARLLAIRPREKSFSVLLLSTESGQIVAEQVIDLPDECGFHLIRNPLGNTWALWAGGGQDGQWTYWIGLKGDTITVDEAERLNKDDHGPVEFSEQGDELLVVAGDSLCRFSFPELRLRGTAGAPEDDSDDNEFLFAESACYLGTKRALVMNGCSSRLYLVALKSMTVGDEVVIAGHEPVARDGEAPCADLWYMQGLPNQAVLTVHGQPGSPQTLSLLSGPPLFGG